ncbi:TPM domain-containing protein [Flavobacterium sp.]|uniref:TPM domain-containing protein n=1 Tax=Flavobacterium sp. TaxID=239 RepID=UPI0040332B08
MPVAVTAQFKIPEKPKLQTSVYDYADFFSTREKQQLEHKLVSYADSTSTQIVIITVETINGESIGELTPKWAHEWGIGQADKDNGILILLAKQERDIWISPGYGVDDRLTAGLLGKMTREVIIPEFKQGNFYGGLDKGTDSIFGLLKGKYKEDRIFTGNSPYEKPKNEITMGAIALNFMKGAGIIILAATVFIGLLVLLLKLLYRMFNLKPDDSFEPIRFRNLSRSTSSFTWPSFKKKPVPEQEQKHYGGTGKSSDTSRSGFIGGFGGGGFSGGGAGGKW